jgi:hypothetical protein
MVTRRDFITSLCVMGQSALTRESDDGSNEIPRAEGFILTGPLTRATDGSDSWTVGKCYLGLHPDSALVPSTRALEGKRVKLHLERA